MNSEIKKLGLQSVENISKELVEDVFKLIEIIVKDTENKVDDMIIPVLPFLKDKVLGLVDKISE